MAVWVGPSGSRAASAGFLITMAADVAAMAPGTHIGAAHPVSGDGSKMDDTMAKKVASDTASYGRTLAQQRKRNAELVEQAVIDSRSFTEQEAAGAEPPLIDVIASDVPDLLAKLDGRTITRFDGGSATLRLSNAVIMPVEMTWAQRVLSAIAHPQIAYLLLTLGMLGLTVEFWNPGAIFPGVAGGICLLLAFFALQVLPVSYAGVLLILLGLVLLVLEVQGHELRRAGDRRRARAVLRLAHADRLAAAGVPDRPALHRAGDAVVRRDPAVPGAAGREGADAAAASPAPRAWCTSAATRSARSTPAASDGSARTGRSGPRPAPRPIAAGDAVEVVAVKGLSTGTSGKSR